MKPPARISLPQVALLVIPLIILAGTATAATVDMNPAMLSLQQGSSATITLTLDSAPDGLAGYRMTITLSNPAAARITGVSYPSWAVISNTTGVPGSAVRISGVDLGKSIEQGAASVPLATITLQGMGAGTCRIITSDSRFDADGGAITLANSTEATMTVSASTSGGTTSGGSSGGASGGGGGSSGSYTGSIVEQKTPGITLTSTPTPTATMAVVSYAAPEGAGTVPPTAPATPASGDQDSAQGESQDSGAGSGLPISPLVIVAGILVMVGIGAFVYLKKKE